MRAIVGPELAVAYDECRHRSIQSIADPLAHLTEWATATIAVLADDTATVPPEEAYAACLERSAQTEGAQHAVHTRLQAEADAIYDDWYHGNASATTTSAQLGKLRERALDETDCSRVYDAAIWAEHDRLEQQLIDEHAAELGQRLEVARVALEQLDHPAG